MANFAQMLATAQAGIAPAQQQILAESKEKESGREVKQEKTKQIAALQKLMEEAIAAAAKKKKGFFERAFGGDIAKLLDSDIVRGVIGATVPFGRLVTSTLSGIEGVNQAKAQKKALKGILNDPRYSKYKGSYLSNPLKSFHKEVEGLRSEIDPTLSGLAGFGSQFATQTMMGKGRDMFKGGGVDGVGATFGGGKGGPMKNLWGNITKELSPDGLFSKEAMKNLSMEDFSKYAEDLPSLLALLQGDSGSEDVSFDPRSYFGGITY